jgi:hypothetical protein
MTHTVKYIAVFLAYCFLLINTHGQSAIPATGGTAAGTSGTVTYSAGQITYNTFMGAGSSIAQGVQQPYEISAVTGIENTEDVTLEYVVYPNPTEGTVKLLIGSFNNGTYSFQLYDLNGKVLRGNVITDRETELSLESLSQAVYFLRVFRNSREVKVFKIVKY